MPAPGYNQPVHHPRPAVLRTRWLAVQRAVGCQLLDGDPGRETASRLLTWLEPGADVSGDHTTLWRRTQRRLGVPADGLPGLLTLARAEAALGLTPPPKPTIRQRAMKEIVLLFVRNWLPRQLLKWAAGLIPLIGVTTDQISGFTAVVIGLIGLGIEAAFSWAAKKAAEKKAPR